MSDGFLFDRIALIGLGLIGSSLAHALKRDGLVGHIAGNARSAATRSKALEIGFIDSAHDTVAAAVADADVVVICAPVGAYAKIAEDMAPSLKKGVIVTDGAACVIVNAVFCDLLHHDLLHHDLLHHDLLACLICLFWCGK